MLTLPGGGGSRAAAVCATFFCGGAGLPGDGRETALAAACGLESPAGREVCELPGGGSVALFGGGTGRIEACLPGGGGAALLPIEGDGMAVRLGGGAGGPGALASGWPQSACGQTWAKSDNSR
jgi:hypothetical protein